MTIKKIHDIRKSVLVVLFIPSRERDGKTPIDQDFWENRALELLGNLFGGATAFPKGRGVWRDDARDRKLVFDEPIVMHCYTQKKEIENSRNLKILRDFCIEMGKNTNQGEIGLVIDNEYLAIFLEEKSK